MARRLNLNELEAGAIAWRQGLDKLQRRGLDELQVGAVSRRELSTRLLAELLDPDSPGSFLRLVRGIRVPGGCAGC